MSGSLEVTVSVHQALGGRYDQEDRYVCAPLGGGYLCAVLDGHGGAAVAERAASVLPARLTEALAEEGTVEEALARAVAELQRETADGCPRPERGEPYSGSTLSLAYLEPAAGRLHLGVLGDSPVLLRRPGRPDHLGPRHCVRHCPGDVERIGRRMEALNGEASPRWRFGQGCIVRDAGPRNSPWLRPTRALGDPDFDPVLIREMEVERFEAPAGTVAIVATDGVDLDARGDRPEALEGLCADLLDVAEQTGDARAVVERAYAECANGERAMHLDNATVVVIRLREPRALPEPEAHKSRLPAGWEWEL